MKAKWALLGCLLFIIIQTSLSAAESSSVEKKWVVAATAFTVEGDSTNTTLNQAAILIPSLLLDHISNSYVRQSFESEKNGRELYELKTERNTLFTQLKTEVSKRDTLLFSTSTKKEFQEQLDAQNKKIQTIKDEIDTNLLRTQTLNGVITEEVPKEEGFSLNNTVQELFRKVFPFAISDVDDDTEIESVALYKDDPYTLFKIASTENIEKSIVDAGINGLISGSVNYTAGYLFVTIKLTLYPGCEVVCTLSDVASSDDIMLLCDELFESLLPYIINSNPITVNVDVLLPDDYINTDSVTKTVITVDDEVFTDSKFSASVRPGIHTISVDSPGLQSESVTYLFSEHKEFNVSIQLQTKNEYSVVLVQPELPVTLLDKILKKSVETPENGMYYVSGIPSGKAPVSITVEDGIVLGEYVAADGISTFFVLPENNAFKFKSVSIISHTSASSDYIEKSRRRMYTSYGLLLISLPVAFFSYGKYVNTHNEWALNVGEQSEKERWNKISSVSIGVSIGLGVNMLIQLSRYLYATRYVLPEEVILE